MGNRGADAYRRRMERAARLRAAGTLENAEPEESAEEAELRRRKEQVDPADKAEYLIRDAMMRGEFDNLKYAGKPIPNLGEANDPDWWVKGLLQRENISGLGPPALLLRVEDEQLDASWTANRPKRWSARPWRTSTGALLKPDGSCWAGHR